ncbi:MAG: hypothetical protein NTV79_07015, partial [Candidatus Aureabacteria bacterium]|nr:hypothetical protein [Candidatus Auribacterota bacterium]
PKAEREAFALLIGATKGENLFEGALLTLKYFFEPLGVRIAGKLLYRRIVRRGDIGNHPTALADAYRAGREFAGGNAEPQGGRRPQPNLTTENTECPERASDNSQGVYPLEGEERENQSPERATDYVRVSLAQPTQNGREP